MKPQVTLKCSSEQKKVIHVLCNTLTATESKVQLVTLLGLFPTIPQDTDVYKDNVHSQTP